MRVLLDTHVFLWMQTDPDRLGDAREVLADQATELFLSAASAWEITIKHTLGRLPLPEPPATYVPSRRRGVDAAALAVDIEDALVVGELPALHRDPFDRMLLAQAQRHELTLATHDAAVLAYPGSFLAIR